MKAQSTIQPETVQVTKIGNKARVRMADNIEQVSIEDEEIFQYDEVLYYMNFKPGLKEEIEADFEVYFNYGVQYMEMQKVLKGKESEIKRLIGQQELPSELENLMLGIAETYEDLFVETLQNSLAIAEIYELIAGGEM